ncbi:hypothetical protein CCACVL1_16984 [Corchorus capsularis]|uniref:Uncharacterized protein n=1 Tax=Corchorus capsularis TaxID=210143 RepID=A0A1R3HV28_COCAP|nr:hypothetical protein CCACVL1_16984 [Corchorus capsularis]
MARHTNQASSNTASGREDYTS